MNGSLSDFKKNLFQLWLKATKKCLALFLSLAADLVQLSLNPVKNFLLQSTNNIILQIV